MGVKILCSVIVLLNALSAYCLQQQQCADLPFNQTFIDVLNQTLESYDLASGTCSLYTGTLCAGILTPNVDYVYVSFSHYGGSETLWTPFIEGLNLLSYVQSQSCKETMRQALCTYYFPRCRNATGYQLPMSICEQGCLQIKDNLCPLDWANVTNVTIAKNNRRSNSVLTNCSNTDQYLVGLPQCCVNLVPVPEATAVTVTSSTYTSSSMKATPNITPSLSMVASTNAAMSVTVLPVGGDTTPPGAERSVAAPVAGGVIGGFVCALLVLVLALVILLVVKRRVRSRESKGTLMRHAPRPSVISNEANIIKTDYRQPSSNDIFNDYSPEVYLTPYGGRMVKVPSGYLRQLSGKMLIPGDCLNVLDCIGQGEFGIVYRSYLSNWGDITTPVLVAVKTVKGETSESQLVQMMEESIKMKDLNHPNILGLIGICIERGTAPYIVMPFMANGSLLAYLKQERNSLTIAIGAEQDLIIGSQKTLLSICLQIAKGMEYLTSQKFVHRDLAARNCMIDSSDVIKVADFGLSEDVYAKNYYRQTEMEECKVKLPIRWMALESLHDGVFSEKSDVWSYGVTCWEVFTLGKIPYPGVTPFSLVKHLDEGGRLEKPSNAACSDEINAMMRRCWDKVPEERPHFWELVVDITTMLEAMADYLDLCRLPTTAPMEIAAMPPTPTITITPA